MNKEELAKRLRQMKDTIIEIKKLTTSFSEMCKDLDRCYDYRTEIYTFEWIINHIFESLENDLNYLE